MLYWLVALDGGVLLQFAEPPVNKIQMQHYAFLVDDDTPDRILGQAREEGIGIWADPQRQCPGEIKTNHGRRGFYFMDSTGHGLEVLTRPYGPDQGAGEPFSPCTHETSPDQLARACSVCIV
jgi:hypothetical protein